MPPAVPMPQPAPAWAVTAAAACADTGSPGGTVDGNIGPGAGAVVAGGTGLGEANSADDTRTGISSGEGASLTGGDPGSGAIPPPTSKGGASAA